MGSSNGSAAGLDSDERDRLAALRSAASLSDLVELTDAGSEREAYVAARREWAALRGRELAVSGEFASAEGGGSSPPGGGSGPPGGANVPQGDPSGPQDDASAPQNDDANSPQNGLPGNRVAIDGTEFWVHGVTHADTRAEREFLREHVSAFLERGAVVYCEQGIRPMYFADLPGVYEMDDLSWATRQCEEMEAEARLAGFAGSAVADLAADVESFARRVRDAMFSLAASRGDPFGEGFAVALGGLASALLTSHEDAAIGDDFESFAKSRRASRNPEALADLQRFYEKTFLPQPLERAWLRRHDPELELLTHARNERMAEYAVYHHGDAEAVHLIVGAAHQPGVTYYLERFREGRRSADDFEYVE